MSLRVIGAGLPRTGTQSLKVALERLVGGRCFHMSVIPGHPFHLGDAWDAAIGGENPDWHEVLRGFTSAVDWPASMFWREISAANPGALILLSERESAETWLQSFEATILPYARLPLAADWSDGCGLADLMQRFAGVEDWDEPATLRAAYDRHNADVRRNAPRERLLEWRAEVGWSPICRALGLPVPADPFPWVNRRSDWR